MITGKMNVIPGSVYYWKHKNANVCINLSKYSIETSTHISMRTNIYGHTHTHTHSHTNIYTYIYIYIIRIIKILQSALISSAILRHCTTENQNNNMYSCKFSLIQKHNVIK